MPRRKWAILADDDTEPVMVPRSERPFASISPLRIWRLRKHLVLALRRMRGRTWFASPARPEPAGIAARVVLTACTLCQGWCCKGGGDHGYLDEPTLARVRADRPELSAHAVVRLYLARVPETGYAGSCLFHGPRGCTLDRTMRSDVCNSYFCAGLDAYLKSGDLEAPVQIIAGEGDRMRTSPVLAP
jgi:hypothetical protein